MFGGALALVAKVIFGSVQREERWGFLLITFVGGILGMYFWLGMCGKVVMP